MEPRVVVALAMPGVVAADLSVAAQVFGFRDEANRYSFSVCTERPGLIESSTGIRLEAPHGLEELRKAETVVLPGYFPITTPSRAVTSALKAAHQRGARLAAVCTGAFVLATTGLLDGRKATTHWREAADFKHRFPSVQLAPDDLFVDGGDIVTGAGQSASVDFYLHLVQQDFGASVTEEIARRMVVSSRRAGNHVQDVRRIPREAAAASDPLSRTMEWAIAHLHEDLELGQLVEHAGLPLRTFTRRFRDRTRLAPMQWLANQRVLEAQRLLERTDLSIEEVAERSGHRNPASLRLHMNRELGTTPTAYRRTHRRPLVAP
jgi:transcriptional regulator GlxA family with amidase domain